MNKKKFFGIAIISIILILIIVLLIIQLSGDTFTEFEKAGEYEINNPPSEEGFGVIPLEICSEGDTRCEGTQKFFCFENDWQMVNEPC